MNKIIQDVLDQASIFNANFSDILNTCYGRYAKYIIQDRALPLVYDGLKPVQRRILYAMHHLNIYPNTAFKKSARIVGEVIGKFHPHGDVSVYDALVRMSQNWKMLFPLINMQGNNGSIDGDNAAAMRYTEIKLTEYALHLLSDLEYPIIKYIDNFDATEKEPKVLPCWIPNLLINGASGISAGYATDIPPHNAYELLQAQISYLKNENITLEEILDIIKGPDFPTKGFIQHQENFKDIYLTGKGKIKLFGEVILQKNHGRNAHAGQIIIKSIPYEINKIDLIKQINEVVEKMRIEDVKEIYDDSTQEEIKIILDIKNINNFENIKKILYSKTNLSTNINYNMVAIYDKKPVTFGIIKYLQAISHFQLDLLHKKTVFSYECHTKRLEIINGLIKSVSLIDEIVVLVRKSHGRQEVIKNLINELNFTENQAVAIADLKLYKLSATDIFELKEEKNNLDNLVFEEKQIIENQQLLKKALIDKLMTTADQFKSYSRKTTISEQIINNDYEEKALISKEKVVVLISLKGFVEKKLLKNYEEKKAKVLVDDIWIKTLHTHTLSSVAIFTNLGNLYFIEVYKILESSKNKVPMYIAEILKFDKNEIIVYAEDIENLKETNFLIFTKKGFYKKILIDNLSKNKTKKINFFKLKEQDEIIYFHPIKENQDICLITNLKNAVIINPDKLDFNSKNKAFSKLFKLENQEYVIHVDDQSLKRIALIDKKLNVYWENHLLDSIKYKPHKKFSLNLTHITQNLVGAYYNVNFKEFLIYQNIYPKKLVLITDKLPTFKEFKSSLENLNFNIWISAHYKNE